MRELTEADHILAALLALLSLSLAFQKPPRGLDLRRAFYIAGAVTGTGIGAAVLFFWSLSGRRIGDLGLHDWWGEPPLTIAAALGWGLILLLVLGAIAKGAFRERLRAIYRRYDDYMPRTRRELAASWVTATAAGRRRGDRLSRLPALVRSDAGCARPRQPRHALSRGEIS